MINESTQTPQSNLVDIYEIGQRICLAREKAGLTQQQLGQAVGLTWVTISQIENGKRTQLNPQRMREIAKALGKTEAYIYGLQLPNSPPLSHFNIPLVLVEAWEEMLSLSSSQQIRIGHIIKEMLSLQRTE